VLVVDAGRHEVGPYQSGPQDYAEDEPMLTTTRLHDDIDELIPGLIADRRYLHENPELGCEEFKTSAFVIDRLRSLGVEEIRTGINVTGVTGLIHGTGAGDAALDRRLATRAAEPTSTPEDREGTIADLLDLAGTRPEPLGRVRAGLGRRLTRRPDDTSALEALRMVEGALDRAHRGEDQGARRARRGTRRGRHRREGG